MQIPTYNGAAPVAKFFLIIRGIQLFAGIVLIGVIASFVSASEGGGSTTKSSLVILTLTCLTALYTLLSLPFFLSSATRGLLIMCGLDFLCLLFYAVTCVILGRSMHTPALSCRPITSTWGAAAGGGDGAVVGSWESWMLQSKLDCYVGKGAWGVAVGVAVCFAATVCVLPSLFAKVKRGAAGKSGV